MANNEKIVNMPLVAGLDLYTSEENAAPPALIIADNCTMRRPGSLTKRQGFGIIESSANVPANAFGGQNVPSASVEALAEYTNQAGRRAVLAAGSTLYEYVGSDAAHGWRVVNALPQYVGTVGTVASVGGSVIEVESLLVGVLSDVRVTVWVTGTRTGQELTSDLAYVSQTVGDGNSVYYAVQNELTGAYIQKPTRLLDSDVQAKLVTSAINLRVVDISSSSAGSLAVFVAWGRTAAPFKIEHLVISLQNNWAASSPTIGTVVTYVACHRPFDVAYITAFLGAPTIIMAYGAADSNNVATPSLVVANISQVNLVTGVLTQINTLPDILDRTPSPAVGLGFVPWATRGLVIEQTPNTINGVNYTFAIAVRTIARTSNNGILDVTPKLDGQFCLRSFTYDANTNVFVLSANQAYVPYSGFQTQDPHSNVTGVLTGSVYRSSYCTGSVELFQYPTLVLPIEQVHSGTNISAINQTNNGTGYKPSVAGNDFAEFKSNTSPFIGSLFRASVVVDLTGAIISVTDILGSSGYIVGNAFAPVAVTQGVQYAATVTALGQYASAVTVQAYFADGTHELYQCVTEVKAPLLATTTTVTPSSTYMARDMFNIYSSNLYTKALHIYPNDSPAALTMSGPQSQQVNQIAVVSQIAGNFGFTPGTHIGVQFQTGGVTRCTATVWVNPAGQIQEIAIENAWVAAMPSASATISGVVGAGPGTITGTLLSLTFNASGFTKATDVPQRSQGGVTGNAQYWNSRGLENCVHRWSVITSPDITSPNQTRVYVAISTTTSITMSSPNGAPPYGAASPQAQNNQFEIYMWQGVSGPLRQLAGGSTSNLRAAIGGPWRMLSGLAWAKRDDLTLSDESLLCCLTSSGDNFQRNTFLVRAALKAITITSPGVNGKNMTTMGGDAFLYTGSDGLFVESCNMMRTTAVPLNTPALQTPSSGVRNCTTGCIRESSSLGNQEVTYIKYEVAANNWRKLLPFADYTFVNGGTLSVFDGVDCNESTMLLWPQRDLTSINWPDVAPQIYEVTPNTNSSAAPATGYGAAYQSSAFWNRTVPNALAQFLVANISDPWWKYKAGLFDPSGIVAECSWATSTIYWGGNPCNNYENVYSDQRMLQFANSSTFAVSGFNQAGTISQHYYGRYNANAVTYNFGSPNMGPERLFYDVGAEVSRILWAPRSALGWGQPANSAYSEADSGGNFIMVWTYEYIDATGRTVVSSTSSPTTFTVCAEVIAERLNIAQTPRYHGGIVSEFKYGFFVPRLELTNRSGTAGLDARRVTMQPYCTAEPFATVLYRMPFSNFLSHESAFVVGRNETRGVVQNANVEFALGNPLGIVTNNFKCFDGPQKDYNGLLTQPMLYTTGDALDNVPPPACKVMCIHQNRLFIGGADDPSVVWYSKELTPTAALGFNDTLTISIGEGGAVTGLASMPGALVVFKRSEIFVVAGTITTDHQNGYAASGLSSPMRLLHGIGCVNHRSVIETPVGIFFQSQRTLELLKSDFSLDPAGLKLGESGSLGMVTSVSHNPMTQEVYFTCITDLLTRRSNVLVYNYAISGWMKWDINSLGTGSQLMAIVGGKPEVVCTPTQGYVGAQQAFYYRQHGYAVDTVILPNGFGGNITVPQKYTFSLATAPFALHEVQGYERMKRISVLVDFDAAPGNQPIAYPAAMFGTVASTQPYGQPSKSTSLWDAVQIAALGNSVYWDKRMELHVVEQKNRSLSVAFTTNDLVPSLNAPFVTVSGFACVIGLKQGLNKRTVNDAKH